MRNMKSLHIFLIIVIKRRERIPSVILGRRKVKSHLWNMKSQGSNVTQRSSWNSIYVTFSFERGVGTSLLMLLVDQLMRVDYSYHFLYSSKLWDVEGFIVSLISYLSLPYVDSSLILWLMWIMLSATCVVNCFLSACQS